MLRKSLDNVPLPGKVFHELARKFDGVPFNAADARDGDLCLIREEMVEQWPNSWKSVVTSSCVSVAGRPLTPWAKLQTRWATGVCRTPSMTQRVPVGVHPSAGALAFSRIESA